MLQTPAHLIVCFRARSQPMRGADAGISYFTPDYSRRLAGLTLYGYTWACRASHGCEDLPERGCAFQGGLMRGEDRRWARAGVVKWNLIGSGRARCRSGTPSQLQARCYCMTKYLIEHSVNVQPACWRSFFGVTRSELGV
ncbi:hypothetical protein BDY17DRAFT_183165 [Neohortaea acidophila]|uniref:Uncharacterized protein n=1 Tax=Neohortaea acidophila TaxID=245834 RepID=A0A6A6PN62_9PEZI|nr:uncharacterized protein BDY17DRAFT_183165 [Neohortaea acidophila]KAF2481131.1 hypothetical protein BDY17DRAFT_183165 [Neohortaea acidophila]